MQNLNICLARGDDTTIGVTVQNYDGSPYNLSGASLTFTSRTNLTYSSNPAISIVTTGHAIPQSGISQFYFSGGATAGMGDVPVFYDIKLFNPSGTTTTLSYGTLSIIPTSQ